MLSPDEGRVTDNRIKAGELIMAQCQEVSGHDTRRRPLGAEFAGDSLVPLHGNDRPVGRPELILASDQLFDECPCPS
jgi:hypothetical protein